MSARANWLVVIRGRTCALEECETYDAALLKARKIAQERPNIEIGIFGSVTFIVWRAEERPGHYDPKTREPR
jgi:hypothetical protein